MVSKTSSLSQLWIMGAPTEVCSPKASGGGTHNSSSNCVSGSQHLYDPVCGAGAGECEGHNTADVGAQHGPTMWSRERLLLNTTFHYKGDPLQDAIYVQSYYLDAGNW